MKKTPGFLIIICLFIANFNVFGFQPIDAAHSNYVVIGAFSIQDHALQFVQNAKKLNFNAISEINVNRNLFYVYVLHTGDRKAAFREANKLRKETPFFDTWVYTGLLGKNLPSQGQDINPLTEKVIKVESRDTKEIISDRPVGPAPIADSVSTQKAVIEDVPVVAEAEEGSKNFLFKIFVALDQKPLDGDVDIFDVERARKVGSFKGNQNVMVRPLNKSGNLSVACEVFGYRKVIRDLNFNKPQDGEGVIVEGNQTIVPFALSRLQKGDLAVMYSVYFFKDAAIMRPESRSEVTSLMEMMKENPKYKIKIHGHTNGGAAGKVISMGESKKFFALTDTKEGWGSAKKLSEERAKVIREYLIAGGVEAARMEIKAWGGKHPIQEKSSARAQENVRVEIEILEDK